MRTIIFKPTHDCNLACPFCYNRKKKAASQQVMPLDKAIFALSKGIREFNDGRGVEIIWHGGEPLLVGYEYLATIFEEFKTDNVHWVIQTNGSLLTPKMARLFKKFNVKVGCSWDGKNNHSEHSWDYVCKVHDLMNGGALFTVTKENMNLVLPSYIFAQSQNVDIEYNNVFGEGNTAEDYKQMAYYLLQLFDFLCQEPNGKFIRPFDDLEHWLTNDQSKICDRGACSMNWIGIQPNGDITRCGKPWTSDFIFGNIFDENFHLTDLPYHPLTKKLDENAKTQWVSCKQCKWLKVCNNGCPFSCYDKQGNFNFNQEYCAYSQLLLDGCLGIFKTHIINKTLRSKQMIQILHSTNRLEFAQWKNYTYPTTDTPLA